MSADMIVSQNPRLHRSLALPLHTQLQGKRNALAEDTLPITRFSKRHDRKQDLFVDNFEAALAAMEDLSHTAAEEPQVKELDLILESFGSLSVDVIARDWRKLSLASILDMPWHSHLGRLDSSLSTVRRAKHLCTKAAITSYRDVLWLNRTLQQSTALKRFPNCLVDIAYALSDWAPRKARPGVTLADWRSAWRALTIAWPTIEAAYPPDLKRALMHKKYSQPPSGVNWFYFDFFDGIWDTKQPLLCYHELDQSIQAHCLKEKESTVSGRAIPFSNPSFSSSSKSGAQVMPDYTSVPNLEDSGNLSDEDPRKLTAQTLDEQSSDSEEDDFDVY